MPSDDQTIRTGVDSAGSDPAERVTIARLASDVVPTLIERLTRSELGELEVREQGWRIRLRRPSEQNGRAPDGPASGSGALTASRPAHGAHHDPRPAHREPRRNVVASPAVGYFSPRDGIQVGSTVRGDDTIGHVDVLGVRVDVVAGMDGKLTRLEVQSGEAVEYGQPIAHLEPAAGSRSPDV